MLASCRFESGHRHHFGASYTKLAPVFLNLTGVIFMANFIEIKDFDAPELDVYARLTENQLLCRREP